MLRHYVFAGALLTSVSALADVGVGASVSANDASIYVPVTAKRFMFEPYFRAADRESETSTPATVRPPGTSSIEARLLGVGIFRLVQPAERVTFYYGGRLGYLEEKLRSTSLVISTTPSQLAPPFHSSEVDGYSIAPTIGFQYHFMERLSIGAELGWEHAELDGVAVDDPLVGTTITLHGDITADDTRSNIILRFFF
jgi:hypothetical protein